MSLATILKSLGKDLSHVGTWIEDGLKIVVPIVGAVDPPVGAIITEVETVVSNLMKTSSIQVTEPMIQAIVTAVATLAGVKVTAATVAK